VSTVVSGNRARLELGPLEDPRTGVTIDLRNSPIFQLVLLDRSAPGKDPLILEAPRSGGPTDVAARNLDVRKIDGGAMAVRTVLPIPRAEGRQWVTVELRIAPRKIDGALEWTATAAAEGKGPWVVAALRYPYLRVRPIGPSGVDDVLVVPLTGGLLLEDPLEAERFEDEFQGPFGSTSRFAYPGYIESQFLAVYDDRGDFDRTTGGLYLAVEDPEGYYKSFFASPTEDRKELDLYVGNFNFAPDSFPRDRPSWNDLASISVGEKLPYRVVTAPMLGDWMDVADRYRAWLERERPVFLSQGRLYERTDIAREVRESLYGIAYRLSGGTRPIDVESLGADPDLVAVKNTLEYFADSTGKPLPAHLTLLGDLTSVPVLGNANDMGVWPVREGLPEWTRALRSSKVGRAIISLNTNRDIGNWSSNRAQDPGPVRAHGLVRLPDGSPVLRKPATVTDPGLHGITCNGSQLVQSMRRDQFERSLDRMTDEEGTSLVDNVALSGRGSQAALCYAPLAPKAELHPHHHAAGGGNFSSAGYRDLVQTLRRTLGSKVRHIFPGGERAHEQLIDTSLLSGRFQVEPWDETFHGGAVWIEGGRPIPLLSYLYHEWDIISARLPRRANVVAAYAEARYGSASPKSIQKLLENEDFLALERQRFAAAALEGRKITIYLEGRVGDRDERIDRLLEAPPGEAREGLEANYRFLREMIRLRGRAAPYLIYGRMLRPPRIESKGSLVRTPILRRDGLATTVLPGVEASAWRSPDGEVALLLANYSSRPATVRVDFEPTSWGLPADRPLRLSGEDGRAIAVESRARGSARADGIRLDPESPAGLFRIEEAPDER
jgi:hypothetical protein